MARLSGLQKDVLSLYRQCLRALKEKPNDTRPHFRNFARSEQEMEYARSLHLILNRGEFRKYTDVGKKDFGTIEYLLRRGRNQLETYRDPGIRDIHG
ncbi:hypothetical protein CC86DRAFT_366102 [Ophiobolus disseminans]|uniref:Complex 1 LYR protein domain-containing protein n=1 Tax=Ophiobolus disseminans TaxID=1469910 RepID=A0A6A7AG82_9PLEO|nr:hypothetical protein CC86DRAFT_366102 [Ophiobolus disseminans]